MSLRYVLDRKAYEEFYGETEYPKSTNEAVSEMRSRGVDATPAVINNLLAKEKVKRPDTDGRNYLWTAKDVDRFIEYFESKGWLTPRSITAKHLNLSPVDLKRAKQNLMLICEIIPGASNADVYATLKTRPMTGAEYEAWRKRVDDAKGEQNA